MIRGSRGPSKAAPIGVAFEASLKEVAGEGTHVLFDPAFQLFRQSIRAYDVGSIALASVGCRAALENAGFSILVYQREGPHGWRLHLPLSLEGKVRHVTLTEILGGLKARGLLHGDLFSAAESIKRHGDAIAHYSASVERKKHKIVTEMLGGSTGGKKWVGPQALSVEAVPLEVLEDIQSTSVILIHLAHLDVEAGKATIQPPAHPPTLES